MVSQACDDLPAGVVPTQSQASPSAYLEQWRDEEEQQLLICQARQESKLWGRVIIFSGIVIGCVLVLRCMPGWTGQSDVVTTLDMKGLNMKAEISHSGCKLQCAARGTNYQFKIAAGKPFCTCTDKVAAPLRNALDITTVSAHSAVSSNTVSGSGSNYFPAYMAFDGNLDTLWNGCCTGYPDQFIGYKFPSVQRVDKYSIITDASECPIAWTFEGSNDAGHDVASFTAATWTTILAETGQACHAGTAQNYDVTPGDYSAYRWDFTDGTALTSGGNGYRIVEIAMYYNGVALTLLPQPSTTEPNNDAVKLGVGLGLGIGIPVMAGVGVGLGLGLGASSASSGAVLGAAPPTLSSAALPPEGILGAMPRLWSGHVPDCLEHCQNQTGFCSFCGQSQACCSRHASHASSPAEPRECWDIPVEHFASVKYQCVNPTHVVSASEAGAAAAVAARHAGKTAQEQTAAAALAASNAEIMTFSETVAAAQHAALAAAADGGLSSDEVPPDAGSVAAKDAAPLVQVGGDCYESCGKKSGYCNFCGKGNACCRYGWQSVDGCRGVVSYSVHKHECVWPGSNATIDPSFFEQ